MLTDHEYQMKLDEMRNLSKGDLIGLQYEIDNVLRQRRIKDVIYYFNALAGKETSPINNHAKAAYALLCKELQGSRRGQVIDGQLDIIEILCNLD